MYILIGEFKKKNKIRSNNRTRKEFILSKHDVFDLSKFNINLSRFRPHTNLSLSQSSFIFYSLLN